MGIEKMKPEEIFNTAIGITDKEARGAYLDKMCGDDQQLRAEVESLLKAHEEAGDFLEVPALGQDVTLESPLIEGPGTMIGRYKLLELIGEGGMGLVYLAEQKEPVKRRLALKIVKPGMDTKQVIARFEVERQALAVLDHPNVAHIYDAGTTETGRPYFVMEYVKGLPITKYCDQNKLNIEQRLRLFEEVCEAVQYAHQKGIIHRDIKPSNILVSMHGDRAVPKIIDFGIAKAITQPLTDKTFVTFQGQLLGTPEYMSPEQVDLATQDIDIRSDIYSLGIVLYELLAGALPFERECFEKGGFAQIQQVIREQEPASPSVRLTSLGEKAKTVAASRSTQVIPLARRLHRELEWIPLKAMRKDRCRRYRSASELADDVRNYLNGLPLIAGPETAVYLVKKFVRRHAGSVATVALVAAAIILGLVISTAMYFRAEKALQREAIARNQAERAEKAAKEKSEDLRRSLYVNSINLADSKYKEGNIARVRELLDSSPKDLRGWEWERLNYISDQSLTSFIAHPGRVNSLALSPDGKRIVSGGWGKTVKVWDIATGKELITIPRAHDGNETTCVAFSPDGKRIISSDDLGEINIWDAASGNKMMTLTKVGEWVCSIALSPDGKRIISCGQDPNIKVWDAETGDELMNLPQNENENRFESVAFSPDGKRIISGGNVIKVWDVDSAKEVMILNGRFPVLYSPDGKRIVSGGGENKIKVWDAATGAELLTLHGHTGPIESLAFSPDGKHIVSGSDDNMIKVWDIATGEDLMTLRGHEHFVTSVVFATDGKQIISGSWDGTIKLWNVTINRELARFLGHTSLVSSMAFSPEGERIVSRSSDGKIKVWDVPSATEVINLRAGKGLWLCSTAFSPDGKQIASLSENLAEIKVWDAEKGNEVITPCGHNGLVTCVSFSPDGKYIASGGRQDETIKIWDANSGKELMTLKGAQSGVICVAFSPDGKFIASGGYDPNIKVWDSATGRECLTLRGYNPINTSVAFSPDGKRIASSCQQDYTVKVWDAITGTRLMTLMHSDVVASVAFSPDGKRVASGCRDRTVRVWDAATGAELLTLRAESGVTTVAFSPDGKTIAAATFGGDILLWESAAPVDGYELRRNGESARKVVDELYEKYKFYYDVIDELNADKTLDESVRKLALQIANSRKWEDTEKLNKQSSESASPEEVKTQQKAESR